MKINIDLKINLTKKIVINTLFIAVIIISLLYFLIFPSVRDIQEMKQSIEAQKIDLEIKYQKGQNLKHLSEKIKVIEPKINNLEEIFVKEDDSLAFVKTLENLAEKHNITQSIKLLDPVESQNSYYKIIPIQLSTQGKYENQMDYLLDLERLDYYINIDILKITKKTSTINEEGEKEVAVSMFMSADTFWRPYED